MRATEDIAIVGRACRLPGAPSVADLWDLLIEGRCAVTQIPADRWSLDRMIHPRVGERGKTYSWSAGVLDDIWGFDPGAFGMSPREAEQMDPQQRLLLELTWEALEDSGIRPSQIAGEDAGVFVGASSVDHAHLRLLDMSGADAYMMTGNTLSVVSNRLSYVFDLHGPSFTVDTACSSALVALSEAVMSLRSGRCDTALVGGVSILASPHSFIGFSQAAMLSRKGLCQAFSANADGYVRAEGGVVLVLKTASAAARDGDAVHAYIKQAEVNSDGRTNGISLPSKTFQARLLEKIYLGSGLDPEALAFVEAHGTGTPVGDPIEATAIGETLGQRRDRPLLIGSVKTNIGHMEPAAGLGGLLKAMLALEHDILPPSLHSEELNPNIDFEALNLKVAREATCLTRTAGAPRYAGVNSFGFGGTNAHVVLTDGRRASCTAAVAPPAYVLLSAQSRSALGALATEYATRLDAADDAEAASLLSATAHRRDRLVHRLVVPFASRAELVAKLDDFADEEQEVVGAARATAVSRAAPVAFIFSGNGSQFAGMGLDAYAHNPVFRDELDAISAEFEVLSGWSIIEALQADDLGARLEQTQIAQPLLFAIQSAAAKALRHEGLEPAFVLGHSVGEVAAAEAAGILDRSNALKTIYSRSHHQELTAGHGGMAVIIASRETTDSLLAGLPSLEIAAYNSPRAFTVSGQKEEIARLATAARGHKARIRKLDLEYPFHSALMSPVEAPLLESLGALQHSKGDIAFVSTVTGTELDGSDMDASYWWRNVREPVHFSDAVAAAAKAGARVFAEIGPSGTLLSHVNDSIDERTIKIATLPAMDKRSKGVDPIRIAVATAIAKGAAVDDAKAFGAPPAAGSWIDLPHYPWQRKTFRLLDTTESAANFRVTPWHPLIGGRFAADRLEWHGSLDTTLHPWLADHCVDGRAILPGAGFAEMALAVARDWLGTDQATVADLEITSPMQLAPDTLREVVCRVSPATNQIEIASRPRLGQVPWQIHATAKIFRDASVGDLPEIEDHGPLPPTNSVTGAEVYALAERAGLQYGPTFRKLESAAAVRADRIVLSLKNEDGDQAFGIDPARMDACFHALVLIFSSLRDAVHGTAYIPVRFGEIMLRKPGATFVKGQIDVLRRDERIIVANFLLTDAAGDVVVFLREARFQAIRTSRGTGSVKQMIYQTSVLAGEPTAARNDKALTLTAFRRGASSGAVKQTISDDFVLLDGWATAFALKTARELATANFIDVAALVDTGRIPARARPWLENILVALERSGLSHKDRLGRHIDPDTELPEPDEILRAIAIEHQSLSAELLVAASAMTATRELVAGRGETTVPPLSAKVIDGIEVGSSKTHASAALLHKMLRVTISSWPRDRAMRVLQVGFGPLSNAAIALADETQAQITIFDPDRRRLERARMTFANRGDIDCVDKIENLPAGSYDLVIAAETLYRHRRLPSFWIGLRRAMARGAVFAALEPVPSFFRDFVFGLEACLSEGEPAFDGQSVGEGEWLETLQAFGLSEATVETVATEAGEVFLLTAQADSERRSWTGSGNALIVGDDDAERTQTMSAFATLLASSGLHVSIVLDSEIGAEHLTETPACIVYFVSEAAAEVSPVKSLTDQCMRLKRLVDSLGQSASRLWIVMRGAVASEAGRSDVAAGLWAFTRTLANETPTLDVRRVDASGVGADALADRLRDLVLSSTNETEILLGQSSTNVVRFETGSMRRRSHGGRVEAACLRRGDGTGIDRIQWEATTRQKPGADEVEIVVEAVGLNFRDVMFGLGLLPEDVLENGFAGPTLGLECAGRIERVGPGVKGFRVGDRVMAFARNAFSTHVVTSVAVVAPVPANLTADTAATIPVAFLTAYYALILCARLKAREWVLIHGGAGGVGLAAIQIARWRGARVIATAGSPERRALLKALGAEHVFDSRSGAFAEDVRRVTEDGVGVVLNSLAGESMERSIGVLRPFGRFVELGKRDYVANTHVGLRPFRRNLTYYGVDLDQLLLEDPATSKILMRSVMRLFNSGDLAPLPYRIFSASETVEAFRLMQQSGHVGKLVVRPPKLGEVPANQSKAFPIAPDKMHVVTGGFGGFGLETARWLAAKGARNIMLIGRNGAVSDDARKTIDALEADGVRVRAEALDIADRPAVQRLFARFGKDLPALAGVVHAAMVLDDAMLANLTADQLERVLRPKIAGADILDQLTRELTLDYFVLFSSATTLIGNPGQAAYVAANGYLEGLARRRRYSGLPALAIAWGAIKDVGVLARADSTREALAARMGIQGMMAQDALRMMGEVLGAQSTRPEDAVVAIAPINWSAARQHLAVLKGPAYGKLASQGEISSSDQDKIDIAALVAEKSADEARKAISGLIIDEIARVLRLPREDVPRTTPMSEIGLDSLMAVELALGLEERFTMNAPLTTTASSFTVNELADHIIGLATGTLKEDEAVARSMIERHLGPAAADIKNFDAHVEAVTAKSQTVKGVL